MKVFTLWANTDANPGDVPYIVDSVDEYTIDSNCDFPPEYAKKRASNQYRELIIDIPEKAVRALFEAPEIVAKIVKQDE